MIYPPRRLRPVCRLFRWRFAGVGIVLALGTGLAAKTPESAPAFAWARTAGGVKNDKIRGMAVDRDGNVFLAGEGAGAVKLGDQPGGQILQGLGELDVFLAKLDADGRFLWAQLAGGSLIDRSYAVATDPQGNCYVTGHYQSTDATIGGTRLPQRGDYDIFVAKYDRDGNQQWIQTAGGTGYDHGHAIAVDGFGDIIITGAVEGGAEFGGTLFPNESGSHAYCAKYRADGTWMWTRVARGGAHGAGQGVAVDGKGNIYIAGLNTGSGHFGDQPLVAIGGTAAALIKVSRTGEVLAITQHLGTPLFHFHEVACDWEGRVWTAGMFRGTVTVGREVFVSGGDRGGDALLCHYGSDGELRWCRAGQGPSIDYALAVATDGLGNSYVTGEFSADFRLGGEVLTSRGVTDVFVAAFDEYGTLRWVAQGGGAGSDNAYALARDGRGNVVLAGSYSGSARFDGTTLTCVGRDLFVASMPGKSR